MIYRFKTQDFGIFENLPKSQHFTLINCQSEDLFQYQGSLYIIYQNLKYQFQLKYFPLSLQNLVDQLNQSLETETQKKMSFFGHFQIENQRIVFFESIQVTGIELDETLQKMIGNVEKQEIQSIQRINSGIQNPQMSNLISFNISTTREHQELLFIHSVAPGAGKPTPKQLIVNGIPYNALYSNYQILGIQWSSIWVRVSIYKVQLTTIKNYLVTLQDQGFNMNCGAYVLLNNATLTQQEFKFLTASQNTNTNVSINSDYLIEFQCLTKETINSQYAFNNQKSQQIIYEGNNFMNILSQENGNVGVYPDTNGVLLTENKKALISFMSYTNKNLKKYTFSKSETLFIKYIKIVCPQILTQTNTLGTTQSYNQNILCYLTKDKIHFEDKFLSCRFKIKEGTTYLEFYILNDQDQHIKDVNLYLEFLLQ